MQAIELPRRRGRAFASAVLAVTLGVACVVLQAPDVSLPLQGDVSSAFVGGSFRPAELRLHTPRAAEMDDEVGEVPMAQRKVVAKKGMKVKESVESVFDGVARDWLTQKIDNKEYKIFQSNWTYICETDGTVGKWNKVFGMPEERFQRKRAALLRRFRKKCRKLRIKTGMGQRYPNGKLIHLEKMRGSPFTVQIYGDKYKAKSEWTYHPDENERMQQKIRARKLEQKMALEREEKRLARLQELKVWPGESNWRKKFLQQVPLKTQDVVAKGVIAEGGESEEA